ncbi:MAG: HEPN domain-containing protein [Patescibacteria group bacterium]
MIDESIIHRNAIASDFRSYADRDYIAARTLFRNQCLDQFLTLAHQSIEKYLKSILLYNGVKVPRNATGNQWHELEYLYNLCKSNIPSFNIYKECLDLVKNLSVYNFVRYPDFPFYAKRSWLLVLDELVWQLRFFSCSDTQRINHFIKKIGWKKLEENTANNSANYFTNGYLEGILKDKSSKHHIERGNLVWKNLYFGKVKKKSIMFKQGFWSKNNHLFACSKEEQKNVYNAVKDYLYFTSAARKYFESIK